MLLLGEMYVREGQYPAISVQHTQFFCEFKTVQNTVY